MVNNEAQNMATPFCTFIFDMINPIVSPAQMAAMILPSKKPDDAWKNKYSAFWTSPLIVLGMAAGGKKTSVILAPATIIIIAAIMLMSDEKMIFFILYYGFISRINSFLCFR